jgi:hypothetical protein
MKPSVYYSVSIVFVNGLYASPMQENLLLLTAANHLLPVQGGQKPIIITS